MTPRGLWNRAAVPVELAAPSGTLPDTPGEPATVVTVPSVAIFRIAQLLVSAT